MAERRECPLASGVVASWRGQVRPTVGVTVRADNYGHAMLVLGSASSIIGDAAGIATALGFIGAAVALIQSGRTSRAANYMTLTQYLQHPETRLARGLILNHADEEARAANVARPNRARTTSAKWGEVSAQDDDAEHAAAVVASSYDIAARAIQMGYVHKEPFVDDYGPSILKCWEYLEPFVAERRAMIGRPRYWDNFEKLAEDVRRWEKRNRQ